MDTQAQPQETQERTQARKNYVRGEYRTFFGAGVSASLLLFALYHGIAFMETASAWRIWFAATLLLLCLLLIIVLVRTRMSTAAATILGGIGWALAVFQAILISMNM